MAQPIAAFVASSTAISGPASLGVCYSRTIGDIDLHQYSDAAPPELPAVTAAAGEPGIPTWRFYLYALIILLVTAGFLLILSVFGPPPKDGMPDHTIQSPGGYSSYDLGQRP